MEANMPAGEAGPATVHRYVSTYCQHDLCAERVCRLRCKMCSAPCLCRCHYDGTGTPIEPAAGG
jgi:hypothetical protein